MSSGQCDNKIVVRSYRCTGRHDKTAIRGTSECRDSALDLVRIAYAYRSNIHPNRGCNRLDHCKLADPGGCRGIPKDGYTLHIGRELFEQLQPFSTQAIFELHKAGGVAARSRQAFDEAGTNRVDNGSEDHRNCVGSLQEWPRHGAACCEYNIRRCGDQFGDNLANIVARGLWQAGIQPEVASLNPAQIV